MSDELNPYAAPRHVESVSEITQTAALMALRAPSLGLLLLSGSMLLGIPMFAFVLCMEVAIIVRRIALGPNPIVRMPASDDALAFMGGFVCIASSVFILRGALAMRWGTNYRTALIAAILACVPILSPLYVFGIPFGIWALIMLRRPAVSAAFRS